jgi:CheY-like chemotaxis protein/HPt (histidine-containing phosphotransfer) domain-containing protein
MQAGDAPTTAAMTDDQLNGPTSFPNRTSHGYAGFRILIVDDNLINCQVAVHMLVKLGCHADVATAGHDAIDMHAQRRYDLILMDCQMPGLDGYQTTGRIRLTETGEQRTAIIGWTSTMTIDAREECIAAGMDDLMGKPIRIEVVREMIARWLHRAISFHAPIDEASENALESMHKRFGVHFAELAALYRTDTLRRLTAMRTAAVKHDNAEIATIAHVLGGSCASMGAIRLSGMCRELENYCKAAFPENLDLLLNEIHDEYAEIDSKIRTLLQSATP